MVDINLIYPKNPHALVYVRNRKVFKAIEIEIVNSNWPTEDQSG